MNKDPYSLNNLSDIAIPEPPPIWPLGPGGMILLAIILTGLLFAGFRLYSRWKQNRYRRAGLALLGNVVTAYDTSVLLKRVALAAFSREDVASLHGGKWCAFLNNSCSRAHFQERFFADMDQPVQPEYIDSARTWIKYHTLAEEHQDNH